MNFVIHPRIREALKRSETVNVRGEVSIPLCRLQSELHRLHIPQQDFKEYLYRYAPHQHRSYIDRILPLLYQDGSTAIIDRKETLRITSGLR